MKKAEACFLPGWGNNLETAFSGAIFWITALVLIVGYIVLEISHALSRRAGTVVRFIDPGSPMLGFVGCEMEVELDTGQKVAATASGCVLCQNKNISPGCRVLLVKQRTGWMVSSSEKGNCLQRAN